MSETNNNTNTPAQNQLPALDDEDFVGGTSYINAISGGGNDQPDQPEENEDDGQIMGGASYRKVIASGFDKANQEKEDDDAAGQK